MSETQFETGWRYDSDGDTWRPPATPGAIGPHQHVLRDLYGSGTFPTGNYTFPGDLTVNGIVRFKGTGSIPSVNRFWDGIEIANPNSAPFIDFHNSVNPEEAADYSWRFIHEATDRMALIKLGGTGFGPGFRFYSDGEFDCNHLGVGQDNTDNLGIMTGGNRIQGTPGRNWFKDSEVSVGTGLRVGGAWGYYGIYAESGDVGMGGASGVIRFQNASWIDSNGLNIQARNFMGLSGAYGSAYAQFSHAAMWNATAYGYMQHSGGDVLLSGAGVVSSRISNSEKFYVDVNATGFRNRCVLNDNTINTRGYGDAWHEHGWWSGNDGLRITEYGGMYFRVRDQDPVCEFLATGTVRCRRFDQIGNYDTAALMTYSLGGGTGAKIGFWSAGQNAAQILKCWGSTIEGRSWDDNGWGTINAVLGNQSSIQGKKNVTLATDKLTKTQRKAKVKKTRAVHYNRKAPEKGWCANCVGTGLVKHRPTPDAPEEDKTCPDCHGDPMSLPAPAHHTKQEEAGWFGFIAEELAVDFPEAVFYRTPENGGPPEPSAVDTLALIAILWDEIKDFEERVAGIEALPAIGVGKGK